MLSSKHILTTLISSSLFSNFFLQARGQGVQLSQEELEAVAEDCRIAQHMYAPIWLFPLLLLSLFLDCWELGCGVKGRAVQRKYREKCN